MWLNNLHANTEFAKETPSRETEDLMKFKHTHMIVQKQRNL